MKKLTYGKQIKLGIVIIILGFILATIFKKGIFINIAWTLYGLLFLIHPVFPANYTPRKRDILLLQLAGSIIALLGLTAHFGV